MSRRRLSPLAWQASLAAIATLGAAAACNYDFDEFQGLAPPLDSGPSREGGAAGAGRSDASGDAAGRAGSAGVGAVDAGKMDGAGGAGGTAGTGAAGTGSGGSAGSSGATGSGGVGGAGAAGGTGGTAGSSGAGGADADGSGGSTVDASADGGGGAGGTGSGGTSGAGGTGKGGTGGTSGAGGTGRGGTGGTGAGGTGGTGAGGKGGTGGITPTPDASSPPDVRVDSSADASSEPPFDCAAAGGRVFEKHCYYAKSTPVAWDVAAKEACAAPAHLVTITSAGEYTFVVSFLTDESRWIGLHRPAGSPKATSAFEWVTGETSTYTHWYSSNGEPDYDGECVRLGPSNNWGDNPCSAAFPVICERE